VRVCFTFLYHIEFWSCTQPNSIWKHSISFILGMTLCCPPKSYRCLFHAVQGFGCKYIQRHQNDYFINEQWVFLKSFSLFHMKDFLNEIFCNLLLKVHIVIQYITYMFCVSHCWINMKTSKCAKFASLYILIWKIIIISNHIKIC
jgi:hypothetical protein